MAAEKPWHNFPKFSRLERQGLLVLMAILLLLFIARLSIHYFVKPMSPIVADTALLSALQQIDTAPQAAPNIAPAGLFVFDPNTLDSAGFLRLGLPPRTVKGLMNWRRHGKVFYAKEDFKALYNLRPEEYERLAPYMAISATRDHYPQRDFGGSSFTPKTSAAAGSISINTVDSLRLITLKGIGPATAHHILEKRRALGGFLKATQLDEVFPPLPDSVKNYFSVQPEAIVKMNLNTVTLERLRAHPYIGEKMAKNILLLREGLKQFVSVEQLRQVPLMNEEKYRKIAPYFTVTAE